MRIHSDVIHYIFLLLPENTAEETETSANQVILQEDPYVSPSFARGQEDTSQMFRHYNGFSSDASDTHHSDDRESESQESFTSDRSTPAIRNTKAQQYSKNGIPDTIIKDGQVFYRYKNSIVY